MSSSRGALVLSLDFEIAWGGRRAAGPTKVYNGMERTRDVVARMLEIFDRYSISATWATVGHLMLRPENCSNGRFSYDLPVPQYDWFEGGWYDKIPAFGEDGWEIFYAPDLVDKIVACRTYQELGSHTFSHIDVGDQGCSAEVALAEFALCQELAQHWGRSLKSVVFPHNFGGHLEALEQTGYRCYRAVNSDWYWFGLNPNTSLHWRPARMFIQPLRYFDERWPLCPSLLPARRVGKLWEIPHSMFFPGFAGISKYVSAEDRAARAKKGLRRAAEQGRLFSLWTHPENLLDGSDPLLAAMDDICREAAQLRDAGKLDILPMEQVAERLDAGETAWM